MDFFCFSGQRVRPGCYLEADKIDCTGAFKGLYLVYVLLLACYRRSDSRAREKNST